MLNGGRGGGGVLEVAKERGGRQRMTLENDVEEEGRIKTKGRNRKAWRKKEVD